MTEVVSVPLIPGIRQDVDRKLLPAGSLVRAENVRIRNGGIGRRNPMIDAGTDVVPYFNPSSLSDPSQAVDGASAASISGALSCISTVGGKQCLIANARVYQRQILGGSFVEGGRCSRALPVAARWVSYDDSVQPAASGSSTQLGVGQVATAVITGYTAVTFQRQDPKLGVSQCVLVLYDLAGVQIGEFVAGTRAGIADQGRQNPRLVACGTYFLWFYQATATAALIVRKVDPPLVKITSENAFATGGTPGEGYDVCSYNGGTEVLVARYLGGNIIAVSRNLASLSNTAAGSWAQIALQTFSGVSSGNARVTVYGDSSMSQIWVAYVTASGSEARAIGYDGFLAGQLANVPLTYWMGAGESIAYAQLSVTRRANGSAWAAITTYRSSGSPAVTAYCTNILRIDLSMGTALFTTTLAKLVHSHLASRLFNGDTDSVQCWLHSDSGLTPHEFFGTGITSYAWRNQRRYGLYTIAMASDGTDYLGAVLQPELQPDERASKDGMRAWLPEVAIRDDQQDENGGLSAHGFVPLLVPVRTSDDTGHDSLAVVLYEWELYSGLTATARRTVEHAGAGHVLGGGLQEIPNDASNRTLNQFETDGVQLRQATEARGMQNGFMRAPAILTIANADDGTASLVSSGVYQFCAVYERIDEFGRRHRSAPSNVYAVTAPDSTTKFTLTISMAEFAEADFVSHLHRTTVHVYATQANGSIFYRVTPNSGAPLAWNGQTGTSTLLSVVWDFTGIVDSTISRGEILYVQGGVKPNQPAPAHRFGAAGAGRLCLGGLFDPNMLEVSKYERPNEPAQFTRDAAFRARLPERCTGLAYLDGAFVAFTRRGIYLIGASALPNDEGSPAVPQPTQLPSSVGCIDWRSVVEVPDGVIFQSQRGIYLLPRGFGQPILISGPVQKELLGRRVVSACVVDDPGTEIGSAPEAPTLERDTSQGQNLLVLSVMAPDWIGETEGRLLVYDLDLRRWVSSDTPGTTASYGAMVANWGGRLAIASRHQSPNDVRIEQPDAWDTGSDHGVTLELADVRPFGAMSRGNLRTLQLLGELRGSTSVRARVARDGKYSAFDDLGPRPASGEAGDGFMEDWELRGGREFNAIGIRIEATGANGNPSAGVILNAIGLEADALPGRPRTIRERS